ncbi:MAG: tetratricopeptide repeat protein [Bacteroidia bacterium]
MKRWITLAWGLSFLWACQSSKGPDIRILSETDSTLSPEIRALCKKIADDPTVAEYYYLRGNTFYYEENYREALIDLQASVSLNPEQPLYHFRLAETYLQSDSAQYPQAAFHLSEALRLKPDYAEAQYQQARLWVARQEYDKAAAPIKNLKNNPDFRDRAFLLEALSFREQKDTAKSEAVLDALLRLSPQNYDANMQKALILLNRHDPLCMEWLDKSLSLDELSDEALYHKGLWNQWNGQYADAMVLYENANRINPGHLYARYNRAVIESLFENYLKSEEHCNQVLDMDANFSLALALRGYCREKLGYKKAAQSDYQAALKLDPSLSIAQEGLENLGESLR